MKIKKNHEFLKENKNNLNINLILQVLIEIVLFYKSWRKLILKKLLWKRIKKYFLRQTHIIYEFCARKYFQKRRMKIIFSKSFLLDFPINRMIFMKDFLKIISFVKTVLFYKSFMKLLKKKMLSTDLKKFPSSKLKNYRFSCEKLFWNSWRKIISNQLFKMTFPIKIT